MLFYFLQTPPVNTKDITALLVAAVVALAGVIVTLALYIRNLHNKHTETLQRNTETMTKAMVEVKDIVANNTKANENLTETVDDLHKTLLKNMP
jgi:FlaG/FlaF family flagellin (archaellin)